MARPKKAKALERLRKALDAITELKNLRYRSPEFKKWQRDTRVAISNMFGDESHNIFDFTNIRFSPIGRLSDDSEYRAIYLRDLQSAASLLESMIEEIEEYWEDENETPTPPETHEIERINKNEVFVIHGRDDGTKQTLARFLETLGLKPVILHEQPDKGRTIIEKFEEHAQVGVAIALLTPDDIGALKDEESNLKPRARQNVIFEFGYFIGKSGRKRVCALLQGDVEKPSDYDGVLYIPLDDSGGWKMGLIKELKTAGFDVDANRVFQT